MLLFISGMRLITTDNDGNVTCHYSVLDEPNNDTEVCSQCYAKYGDTIKPLLLPLGQDSTDVSSACRRYDWPSELSRDWQERLVSTCAICSLFTLYHRPNWLKGSIALVWGRRADIPDALPPGTAAERSRTTLWFCWHPLRSADGGFRNRCFAVLYEDVQQLKVEQDEGYGLNLRHSAVDFWVDFRWLSRLLKVRGPKLTATPYSDRPQQVTGVRLIDCKSNEIVDANPKWPYLALSYACGSWPSRETVKSARAAFPRLPLVHLPPVVRDAIVVTRNLGHQYLWVDVMCIGNDDHRKRQVAAMDLIYRGATATIVALGEGAGADLPGVLMPRCIPSVRIGLSFVFGSGLDSPAVLDAKEIRRSSWSSVSA
jgi:hypothetical protein